MKIKSFTADFSREQLLAPFGFKGAYLNEMWQSTVRLTSANGFCAEGVGVHSVLWSDSEVFVKNPESVGNAMMFLSTAGAARLARDSEWDTPIDLVSSVLKSAHEHACGLTGRGDKLRLTFTLNSMVAFDNAAWLLMAREKSLDSFDAMIPEALRKAFSPRQQKLVLIPLVSYGVSLDGVGRLIDDGCCLLKIKIGSDPDKDGDPAKMLEWDKNRISEIHALAEKRSSEHTDSGNILYYLDANGRYDSLERVAALLKHAEKIGALDRIILLEEPFPEDMHVDVSQLPVRIAADESAHSLEDVEERIALGYGAIALKPIAKTLSMSLLMLKAARERGIPCFCADLTVTPALVEWNKNVAARLAPLPGMKIGAMETNGSQNYRDWDKMLSNLAVAGSSWLKPENGVFNLDDKFYAKSGGIFDEGVI